MPKKRQRSEEDPQFEILCETGMTTVNDKPVELNKLAPHLRDFRIEHYRYINQLLGDRTLRQLIMNQFPSKEKLLLRTDKASDDFDGGWHHVVRQGRSRKPFYCSVNSGIQDVIKHPLDTLCQSYSVGFYFGDISTDNQELTHEVQTRMINRWFIILENPIIQGQIIDAVQEKREGEWYQKDIPENERNEMIIPKIKAVLSRWFEFGWILFELTKTNCTKVQMTKAEMENDD